ncbi:FHA domain-containing protein, partial [Frankia sp. CpI1-P]|uniref:FHA domain-containing protein n=1 Tax=Frankia sp. CpI1-P TaxID=1502734 RepID=UPI0037BFD8AD
MLVSGTPLRVHTPAGEVTLTGDEPAVVGRARSADIVINDGRVSRRHLVLHPTAVGWRVEDISANGLWCDGRRLGDVDIVGELRLRLGAADGPEVVLLPRPARPVIPATAPTRGPDAAPVSIEDLAAFAPTPVTSAPVGPGGNGGVPGNGGGPGNGGVPGSTEPPVPVGAGVPGQPSGAAGIAPGVSGGLSIDPATAQSAVVHDRRRVHPLRPGRMRMGRSRDNEINVGDLLASRHHAELHISLGGVELVDLASANGTFVNGHRISRAPVMQRDVIAI